MSAEIPRTEFDLVDRFWDDLMAVERRQAARVSGRSGRRQLRRTLAIAVLVLLAAAALALAAAALLGGDDAPPSYPARLHKITGPPVPGRAYLLAPRTPDPSHGPPWAVRYYLTTRGNLCFQVGRVVRGELVALGVAGAFHNDGRFHRLPLQTEGCSTPRANGQFRFAAVSSAITASGLPGADACLRVPCRRSDRRTIIYGTTPRGAASVTFAGGGRRLTQSMVDHRLGLFLFVLQGPPPAPSAGQLTVRYDDGLSCPYPNPLGPTPGVSSSATCQARENGG